MLKFVEPRQTQACLLVLAGLLLVHQSSAPALERRGPPGSNQLDKSADAVPPLAAPRATPAAAKPLPGPVEEMHHAILAAAHSGRVEELRVPLEWNELAPDIAPTRVEDPIAYWKKLSGDGEGREILAVLANILDMKPAELPLGKDIENNIVYVWPYLAEAKLDQLSPSEEVDLLRLVSPADAKSMREKKKWTWWRLAIGADGTWHSFKKAE
jgi:hypothetical protein